MRRPAPILFLVLAASVLQLAFAPGASAGEYAAPVSVTATCATGSTTRNSGGRDAQNNLYIPCGSANVLIVSATGSTRKVAISQAVGRIAPSPDGTYLYSIQENWSGRFVRQPDGSYLKDTVFKFQQPDLYKAHGWPICGWGVATDRYGDVYLSTGGWCTSGNRILKYAPDGTYLTGFGDWGASAIWEFRVNGTGALCTPGPSNCLQVLKENHPGALPGQFQVNFNIAVTDDGSRVWVADNNNMRVQWFDRVGGAEYVFGGMWNGEGAMYPAEVMGSTYGIAVDPWGSVYVAATTRMEIWRLDPDGTHAVKVSGPAGDNRPHALAVDARGSVWVGEWGKRIDRVTPVTTPLPVVPPKPPIDRTDPILRGISAPSETTGSSVTVAVDAIDDVQVTEMRIADESGDWQAWQPYRATFTHELSAGIGTKTLYLQVRDGRRAESALAIAKIARKPVPDVTAPTVGVTGPATSTVRAVSLAVTAADAVGVTHLRIAGDDGNYGDWIAWANGTRAQMVDLGASYGTRTFTLQVRDAAYNISDAASVTIQLVPVPVVPKVEPKPDPVGVDVDGGGSTLPTVDRTAPTFRTLLAPARSCSRRVVLRLAASDAGGVRFVRIANEDGRYGRWLRYSPRMVHVLSRSNGRKLVTVQVRDATGNVSRALSRRILVARC